MRDHGNAACHVVRRTEIGILQISPLPFLWGHQGNGREEGKLLMSLFCKRFGVDGLRCLPALAFCVNQCLFLWQDLSEFNATAVKSPTNTVKVQNLKAGTIYVFQVRARTVAGYGRYSGKMYFQTMTEGEPQAHSRNKAGRSLRLGQV